MGQHETIPNRRLRRALEFALEVAADLGDDDRVPEALRRHRRGAVAHQAIGPLRRAVEADDRFRVVVAERLIDATEALGQPAEIDGVEDVDGVDEPVDSIGSLWILRPPGWREAVDLLLELERQQSEIDALETARRREERRREAAEARVERERAENERLRRKFETSTAQAAATADRIAELERRLEMASHELNEARMKARHAGDRERAARDRLERMEAEARSVTVTDSPPPSEPGADRAAAEGGDDRDDAAGHRGSPSPEWRRSLAAELVDQLRRSGDEFIDELVTDVVERLMDGDRTESGDLAGVADVPAVERARRRRALRMPPGVLSESAAGVDFLLRSGARVIVDGYNVSKTAWPRIELVEQRERLLALLETVSERHGIDVQVVFDGADVVGAATSRRRLVDVVFSPAGVIADEVIGREVRRLPVDRAVVVVTDDREVRDDVRSCGANVVASAALVEFGRR